MTETLLKNLKKLFFHKDVQNYTRMTDLEGPIRKELDKRIKALIGGMYEFAKQINEKTLSPKEKGLSESIITELNELNTLDIKMYSIAVS